MPFTMIDSIRLTKLDTEQGETSSLPDLQLVTSSYMLHSALEPQLYWLLLSEV
jgi:hypothetical protein